MSNMKTNLAVAGAVAAALTATMTTPAFAQAQERLCRWPGHDLRRHLDC